MPPVIIDLNEDSDEEDEEEQQQDELIDVESDGFCILCGGEEERGRWFGCDYCRSWQHENCMAPRHRVEARRSVGTARWQCFSCRSLQGRVTGHLCCALCFQGDGDVEVGERGGWVWCLGGGECPLACHADCLSSTDHWMCPSCQRSEA